MSRWVMTLVVDVDDEMLAEHDGGWLGSPPGNDVAAWTGLDLVRAVEVGVVDPACIEVDGLTAEPAVVAGGGR